MRTFGSYGNSQFVVRIRQSHISYNKEIKGENEIEIKRVKICDSLLYDDIYPYLRFKGELAIGNSMFELGHHLRQGGNDYLDIYLLNMEDVERLREFLKHPMRIFYHDKWCDVKVHFKKLFTIEEYVKLGSKDEIEKQQHKKLKSEPHITLKFYLSEPKDSEDMDTIIDWLHDQLLDNMIDVNFEKSYSYDEEKDDVEIILPARLREDVIKFMVNTFDVPDIGSVTFGPKIAKEPTPVDEEYINEKLEHLNWDKMVKVTDFKLKGNYSEESLDELREVCISFIQNMFVDFAKNVLVYILNKEKMEDYLREQKEYSVFEEKAYESSDRCFNLFAKLAEYKNGLADDIMKLFKDFTDYVNNNKEEYINKMKTSLINLKEKHTSENQDENTDANNDEEIHRMVDEYLIILDSQEGDILLNIK